MKPVNQIVLEEGKGDCMRAAVASLLELELEQVPHFNLFKRDIVMVKVLNSFANALGYKGSHMVKVEKLEDVKIEDSIENFFYTRVPSKTFEGSFHVVITDERGIVAHDPNPNKRWQDKNLLKELPYFYYKPFRKIDGN